MRANLNAKLKVSNCTYGQAILTFICTVAVKENKNGDLDVASKSVENILEEIEKHFSQPDVIDKRRKKHFVEEVMPNAPDLTRQEEGMLKRLGDLQAKLQEKGETSQGISEGGCRQIPLERRGQSMGCIQCRCGLSAKAVLAELGVAIDTYKRSSKCTMANMDIGLPRVIRNNMDGTEASITVAGKHAYWIPESII